MANRSARVITDTDRRRLWSTLDAHAKAGNLGALRTRAIVFLTADTGLRLKEVLALTLEQLIENGRAKSPRIVSAFHLAASQAKGRKTRGDRRGYTSARLVLVPRRAREALLSYFRAMRARGELRRWVGSPWITIKGAARSSVPGQRAIQDAFAVWQSRAGIREAYRWHDLRHTAITRWARASPDVFAVAELAGHANVRTTQGYVHQEPARLAKIAEAASSFDDAEPSSPPAARRRRRAA